LAQTAEPCNAVCATARLLLTLLHTCEPVILAKQASVPVHASVSVCPCRYWKTTH